ncbi:helix-turn-helix domain-containing protein [Halomonas sp. THAF12]|uniref:helix-turn-helix domain-containing protein n=1 Tax=Halomonas sp. B23F22_10 TaxID=3459515 RepID=UPI00373F80BF
MHSLITTAARALAQGDPLGALDRVALCDDAPALALRGIAMAQLGDFARARTLLQRAARAFGPRAEAARARCVLAEAEIALVARELGWSGQALAAARATLEAHGDRVNAAHARYLEARRLLLIGRLDAADERIAGISPHDLSPASLASCELVKAGIALRRLQTAPARAALDRADRAARDARVPALMIEVELASKALTRPTAMLIAAGETRPLLLEEVEALLATPTLVVDACRHLVRADRALLPLGRRPVLFTLARLLGEAWPDDVPRQSLIARAFRQRHPEASHRARLRVEIGRLRRALGPLAGVVATPGGYRLAPAEGHGVAVLAPLVEGRHARLLALLADGEAWSSSALALALDTSQRSVQRALDALSADGKVEAMGRGRSRRWLAPPVPGFPTTLLLPAALPNT